jgi:hypothetical protein
MNVKQIRGEKGRDLSTTWAFSTLSFGIYGADP